MNIFAGNLSYDSSQDEIKELFEQFGTVSTANLIKDRESGRSKGFCFIEMDGQEDAERAISELDGSMVKGRNIKVNEARPKTERPRYSRRD